MNLENQVLQEDQVQEDLLESRGWLDFKGYRDRKECEGCQDQRGLRGRTERVEGLEKMVHLDPGVGRGTGAFFLQSLETYLLPSWRDLQVHQGKKETLEKLESQGHQVHLIVSTNTFNTNDPPAFFRP